jgi:uncharacterized membrane protein HdeD (DUF308 family)
MPTSIFLAKLMGPIFLAVGGGMLVNAALYRAIADEFLRNPALIYLSGVLTLTAGLAIVLNHNVWTGDWRVLVTVLGWLAILGGVLRILAPPQLVAFGRAAWRRPVWPTAAGAIISALGALLCFFGYIR